MLKFEIKPKYYASWLECLVPECTYITPDTEAVITVVLHVQLIIHTTTTLPMGLPQKQKR